MTVLVAPLEINADLFSVRELGPWLHDVVAQLVPEQSMDSMVGAIELAIHELCINIVEHSYASSDGLIGLRALRQSNFLVFDVVDSGRPFGGDLGSIRDTSVQTIRGYGLAILNQLASYLAYERAGEQNHWTVQFAIEPAEQQQKQSEPTITSRTNQIQMNAEGNTP